MADEDEQQPQTDMIPLDSRQGSTRPGLIKNKLKRHQVFKEQKRLKRKDKKERVAKRKREEEILGPEAKKAPEAKTLENTRELDETVVQPDDEEVAGDTATDELASYFAGAEPKVAVTTSNKPVGETFQFAEAFVNMIPSAEFYPRKGHELKKMVKKAIEKGFTDLYVINEDHKKPNAIMHIHLPEGPTALFKLSSITYPRQIRNHGRATMHYPEVILNNFHTRLGHQIGRLLSCPFPQDPEFQGRTVVTFHNQRDFIFVRRHRYMFKNKKKVGLQELGPRFTLKLRWLQKGTFDSKFGEYEWVHKPKEMDTSRRRFFL